MFAKEVCYIISVPCSTIILRPPERKQIKNQQINKLTAK